LTDSEIIEQSIADARAIRNDLARELVDGSTVPDDDYPIAIFMAGAPGAGKTEASKQIVEMFDIIRIDPDEFRCRLPLYDGANSRLVQPGVSLFVDKIIDRLIRKRRNKSFLLDGTFSNLKLAQINVSRSLKSGRDVLIWYVYQDPELSWQFVQAREKKEGRGIPLEIFIDQYINSRFVVQQIKDEFDDQVVVDVMVKPIDPNEPAAYYDDVLDLGAVCPNVRTREQLRELLAD